MENARYLTGFNHGYLMARYEPAIMQSIGKSIFPQGEYLAGFCLGRQEYEREQERERLSDLKKIRDRSRDLDRDMGKG
jgi:hypothetical protein